MNLRFERLKLWRSRRPWLALFSLAFFLVLMLVGFYTYAQSRTMGEVEFKYTFENQSYFNGLTFALYAFYFGFLLILPVLVATEGGVHIAGETQSGTLRLLLTRPLSRSQIFFSKVGIAGAYTFLLVGGFLLLTMTLGLFLVGWGDLDLYPGVLQMTDRQQHLDQEEALWRFAMAWPAACISLMVPLAMSFLLSTWFRNPVNAVGISVVLYLVLYVISEIHFFAELRPWLFTSYMAYWRQLFREEIDWVKIGESAAKLGAFLFLFLGLAFHRFRTREETV